MSTHHNKQTYTLEEEQEISERVSEFEQKFDSLDRTTRMLEQLRDSHATGVDNLMKLNLQSEQLGRVEKLTNEQEQQIKGLGKYKKFNKYMKRLSRKDKEEKPKPNQNQEIHNEVTRLKIKNDVDKKIFAKRQNDEKEKREKRLEEYNAKYGITPATDDTNNPFVNEDGTTTTSTSSKSVRNQSSPKLNGMTEDEMFEKKGMSKLWSKQDKDGGSLSKNDRIQLENAIETKAIPMDRLSEECVKDNVFIQRSAWIKKQDAQLDEMGDILLDLKNISLATQTEVQTQSVKLDDIGESMDRGSDFSLKKKSKRSIEKEQKKKEKEEKEKIKREQKTKEDIDKQVKKDFGVGVGSK